MKAWTSITPSELYKAASHNNFEVIYLKEFIQEQKFKGVEGVVKQHMIHALGEFDKTHFNVEAMKRHYGEGEVSLYKEMIAFILELKQQ